MNNCQQHCRTDNAVDGLIAVKLNEQTREAVINAALNVGGDASAVDTAGAAHASTAIQTNAKTIDEDTYNLLAFDQCDGAWPIGHPLPLPMWSNAHMAPLIVDKVRRI